MLAIFVDADGCPVKGEIYRVAARYGLSVRLVANKWMQTPDEAWIEMVVVDGEVDAADDWIVDHVGDGDIVISADILLAARCLKKGARVLGPKGRPFTKETIGDALATRELMADLREMGTLTGGPAPFEKRDRSRFLQCLDETIQAVRQE